MKTKFSKYFKLGIMSRGTVSPFSRDNAMRYLYAVIFTFIAGGILITWQGENPLHAIGVMLEGSLGSVPNFATSLRWATPCLIAGAACIIAFRSGVNNIGIIGQVYVGALAAGLVGRYITLPHLPHVFLCLLAAGIAGMLYALIPALLRMYFGVNELVSTIMLNTVATLLTTYLVTWKIMGGQQASSGSASIKTESIGMSARLTTLIKGSTCSTGVLIGIVLLVLLALLYKHTNFGYEVTQIGQNMEYARVGGVNVVRRFFTVFMLSGLVAGLCGGVEVCGSYYYFLADFSQNLGWEAIMVASVSQNNPLVLMFFAFIWGIVKTGSLQLERATTLTRYLINIIQMLFVIFVSVDYSGLLRAAREKRLARSHAKAAEMPEREESK